MTQGKALFLDGLDGLRDRLQQMEVANPGWVFKMQSAPYPYPASAVQVEAYSSELNKHGGIIIPEQAIDTGLWTHHLAKLEHAIKQAADEVH